MEQFQNHFGIQLEARTSVWLKAGCQTYKLGEIKFCFFLTSICRHYFDGDKKVEHNLQLECQSNKKEDCSKEEFPCVKG